VWERRYAFPQPQRDANDERRYPVDQVHKLRLVQRLLELGCRPGQIMHLNAEQLGNMAHQWAALRIVPQPDSPALQRCMTMVMQHQMTQLRQHLTQSLLQIGLRRLILELVAPLTAQVGQAWANGTLAAYQEHLFAHAVRAVLHHALHAMAQHRPLQSGAVRVLLTTMPHERHDLGLLMVEAMFTLHGAECLSLGVPAPLHDVLQAVQQLRADMVVLPLTSALATRPALNGLADLRARLAPPVELWVGGARAALGRRKLAGCRAVELDDIGPALDSWRLRQSAAASAD
jgi:methanogenic corrinoid protein MtbC1